MAGIPQVITEDRASSAQVINGSARFDDSNKSYLSQDIGNGTNGFTLSFWMKPCQTGNRDELFDTVASTGFYLYRHTNGEIKINNNSANLFTSNGKYRDTSAFYNIVFSYKPVAGSTGYGLLYVNGKLDKGALFTTQLHAGTAKISSEASSDPANYYLSQWYLVDGLQLGPEYFGFTDPLTGTWRPKKFKAEGTTVNDGTDWSGNYSGGGGDPGPAFDGTNPSQNGYAHSGSGLTITFPKALSGRIIVYGGTGGGGADTYTLSDGSSLSTDQDYANSPYFDALDFGEKEGITSLTCSPGYTLHGISVDGVMLTDSTTQNLDFGTNGFYLPLDGNSLIGQDLSGKGNDWKPVNFGGSVLPENSFVSGAKPIRNNLGGTVAKSGVFGSNVGATYKTTSLTNSTGKYYFAHDPGTAAPSFNFIRGATYVFDNTIGSTHTLRLSTTSNGTWGGGSVYTDGVETFGNFTVITVPHDAPNTLYYFCTVHTGMGGSINVTTDETKADKYASSLVLACPYAGDKEDVSNQINCTVSSKGSDNYGSIQKFKTGSFYNSSRFFDGVDDNINYSSSSTLRFDGAFTIEMYASPDAANTDGGPLSSKGYYSANTGNWYLRFSATSGGKISFYSYQQQSNGQENYVHGTGANNTDRMYHIVCQRDSSNLMTFMIDGVIVGQGSNVDRDLDDGASNGITVGRIASGNSSNSAHIWYGGSVSDLRIYKGIDKYDVSGKSAGDQVFIPASANPDILPDSPSGVAVKSRLKKITDGSVSIDRDSDEYLQVLESTDFRLDGQYCIEFFLNLTDYSNDSVYVRTFVLDGPTGDGGSTNIHLNVNPSNGVLLFWSGGGELMSGSIPISGGWHHVCLTRDSSNKTRLFIDGVLSDSADITTDYNLNSNQNRPRLGALGNTGGTTGHYSNWRIIKGSIPFDYQTASTTTGDRYFVPPTGPLTTTSQGATANDVKLIACQDTVEPGRAVVSPTISGPNDGTQWSHYVTGDIDTSFPAWRAFRNDTASVGCRTQTSNGATIVWQPPSPIAFSSSFKIWAARDGSQAGTTFTVTHAGGDTDFTSSVVTSTTQTAVDLAQIGGVTSPITKITIVSGGPNPRFSGIEVDTVMLVDPVSPRNGASATTFNAFNSDIDTVRAQEGAYATFNPLVLINGGSSVFSDNNLQLRGGSTNGATASTINPTSGKYYLELGIEYASGQTQGNMGLGIVNEYLYGVGNPSGNSYPGTFCGFFTRTEINSVVNGSETGAQTTEPNVNYTLGLTIDYDAKSMTLFLNGVVGNTVSFSSITNPLLYFLWGNTGNTMVVNFGQKPFKYAPPDGFQPLTSSTLLPDTVIARSDQYVGVTTYTGNNTNRDISTGQKPDLIWCKSLNNSYSNSIYDSVRGPLNRIKSNSTDAAASDSSSIISFNADGYTTGNSTSTNTSSNSATYVAWTWKAGGNAGTWNKDGVAYASAADAGLTGITSPATLVGASIGTKQGFSIIRWNRGANHPTWTTGVIPHGLTQTPGMIITKNLGAGHGWMVFHTSNGVGRLYLNETSVAQSGGYTTLPTATHFTMDNTSDADSADDCVSYCWHDVPGLQKFGKYTGNSSTSGPYVELGFKPAVVMVKRISGASANWYIMDYKNQKINPVIHALEPNTSDEMNTAIVVNYDFLSNGFMVRGTDGDINASGHPYLYAAWAEAPAFNLYGAQSNAR